jgi:hypothetical protein
VGGNHPVIVDLHRGEYREQQEQDARANDSGFAEWCGNAETGGEVEEEARHLSPLH